MNRHLIHLTLEYIKQIVDAPDMDWRTKRTAFLNEASEEEKTALAEFVSWFEEPAA